MMLKCDTQFDEESKFGYLDDVLDDSKEVKGEDASGGLIGSYRKLNID